MDYTLRNKLASLLFSNDTDCDDDACEKLYQALKCIDYKKYRHHHGGVSILSEELDKLVRAAGNPFHMLHRYRLIVLDAQNGEIFVAAHNGDNIKFLFSDSQYRPYESKHNEDCASAALIHALHPRIGENSSIFKAFGCGQHPLSERFLLPLIFELTKPSPSCVLQDDALRTELFNDSFSFDHHDPSSFTIEKPCQLLYRLLQNLDWVSVTKTSTSFLIGPEHPLYCYIRILFQQTGFMHFFNFYGIVISLMKSPDRIMIAPQHGDNVKAFFNLSVLCN